MKNEEEWLLREKYGGEKTAGFFTDLKRLQAGEPLAYLIGFTPFLNCKIFLDSRPLIPRTETEYWVEKAIQVINASEKENFEVLDLCAGSGCIGTAVAKACSKCKVDFVEIDEKHNSTIDRTIAENKIASDQVRIINSDLFKTLTPNHQYDFIFSNPPYIDPKLDRTEHSVTTFEPHLALYGGHIGLEIIERIINGAPNFLTPDGQLWIEHEPEQVADIKNLAENTHFAITTHKDQYNLSRFSILTMAQ